jgi:hypothetical protein
MMQTRTGGDGEQPLQSWQREAPPRILLHNLEQSSSYLSAAFFPLFSISLRLFFP